MRRFIYSLYLLLILFLALPSYGQSVIDHWETAVYDTATWKYNIPSSAVANNWVDIAYNDAQWQSGQGGFGYGDGDETTIIAQPTTSVYLRKKFIISDLSKLEKGIFHIDYDDGYVAFINGIEVGRGNMGSNTRPAFNQFATGLHEASIYQGLQPEGREFSKEELIQIFNQGENIIAVQVHNFSVESSDLSARPFLSFALNTSDQIYYPTPRWFSVFEGFSSSNLPLVVINTNGQFIDDNIRIVADMGVIDNGLEMRNSINDSFNNYNGKISIETRGESSQYLFPKKSYGLETQNDLGENNNVPLLGMPEENDWILYAPYSDKTLMRNVLAYELSRETGRYASRSRYCELILNGDYQGIYVLQEKIKQDSNRIDIAKLNPVDIDGDELTGGYILRVDKIDDNDYPGWETIPIPQLPNEGRVFMQFYDPKGDELVADQRNYIRDLIFQFESVLSSNSFDDPFEGYAKYIAEPYFIDFMLINEIAKNVDAYIFSTYLFKDKDSNGGKLKMGPVWDFNLGFGNVDYHENSQYAPGWMYEDSYRMYWFRRLMSDPKFSNRFQCRWNDLRETVFSNEHIMTKIDSIANLLQESQERNFTKWQVLGNYVWPNQFVGNSFEDEILFLKRWISDRLNWMDLNLSQPCQTPITGIDSELENKLSLYPNPTASAWTITGFRNGELSKVTVFDKSGHLILQDYSSDGSYEYNGPQLSEGMYLLLVRGIDKYYKPIKLIIAAGDK